MTKLFHSNEKTKDIKVYAVTPMHASSNPFKLHLVTVDEKKLQTGLSLY